ncbi:MAG: hypothetical protein CSA36_07590 [Draconibacterium sp.]|nr:MAG: hypothetical protein CSA36_07590 [Draconibacterium sp.]
MVYQLPIPKSPEVFENIVCDLINQIYKTSNFSLYGRKGQNQKGIDIISSELNIVVQCKLRTLNLNKRKTKIDFVNEIIKDIRSALSLNIKPEKFIIATTLENDNLIQDYLNTLMIFNNLNIVIEFWSWSKISSDIFLYSNIVNKYYPFRNNSLEFARINILNKSVYKKSKTNELLFEFQNNKNVNQLPVFDISFINNSQNTILLNKIDCFCHTLSVARGGFPPVPNGILKPTKKFIIDFKLMSDFINNKPSKEEILLEDPIFVNPKSPLRIQIQNKKPLTEFYRVYFIFHFNNEVIQTPNIFFNSDHLPSGKIVTEL